MSTPGWKNSLMTVTPGYVCDSTCSTSLTMVVTNRSMFEVMRPAISSGDEAGVLERHRDHRDTDVRERCPSACRSGSGVPSKVTAPISGSSSARTMKV